MSPLHIQRNFNRPIRVRIRPAFFEDFAEAAIARSARRQAELFAEHAQIRLDVGVIIRVHDADYLAGALVRDLVETIGVADLARREGGTRRTGYARTGLRVNHVERTHEADWV